MRFGITGQRDDRFRELEQRLQRPLTPAERKWLTLADAMMRQRPPTPLVSLKTGLPQLAELSLPGQDPKPFLTAVPTPSNRRFWGSEWKNRLRSC